MLRESLPRIGLRAGQHPPFVEVGMGLVEPATQNCVWVKAINLYREDGEPLAIVSTPTGDREIRCSVLRSDWVLRCDYEGFR